MFSLVQEYWRHVVMAKEIENFLQLALLLGNYSVLPMSAQLTMARQ